MLWPDSVASVNYRTAKVAGILMPQETKLFPIPLMLMVNETWIIFILETISDGRAKIIFILYYRFSTGVFIRLQP